MTNVTGDIATEKTANANGNRIDSFSLLKSIDIDQLNEENFQSTLDDAICKIVSQFDADNGYILLKKTNSDFETLAKECYENSDELFVTASEAVAEMVIDSGEGVIVSDAINNKDFDGDPKFQRFNIGSVLCSPLGLSQSPIGVLYLDSKTDKWGDDELEQLQFVSTYLGFAVNCVKSRKENVENARLAETGRATLELSHSVKNILQMVGGAAEVIDFGLRSNQIHRVKSSWDILKPNIERLRKFTLDMLDYSKERKLELGECDFNRVIQGSIESLKSQLKMKKSKLNIRIDRDMPLVELDEERIHEMSLNLILNAIDVVEDSGGVVSVETKFMKDEGTVQLLVTDNGHGMTDEIKKKIFTPFESGKNKFGTGLGMPIAKQVVDQHNGRIEIESVEGKGTTFTVILPAKIAE